MKDVFDKATGDLLSVPAGATWGYGFGGVYHLVPVSFVAKDWKVTPRRIRALLAEGRLQGRQQANGYWEVIYIPISTLWDVMGHLCGGFRGKKRQYRGRNDSF